MSNQIIKLVVQLEHKSTAIFYLGASNFRLIEDQHGLHLYDGINSCGYKLHESHTLEELSSRIDKRLAELNSQSCPSKLD